MKKSFTLILGAAALFTACGENSSAESVANTSSEVAQVEELQAPVFFFGENGERLTIDSATGAKVAKTLDREKLVVADENAYKDLLASYAKRMKNDEAYAKAVEMPADYVCHAEYLAVTADYESVTTEDGKVLLDDKVLFDDCIYAGNSKALMKTYTDPNEIDSVSIYTKTVSGKQYRIVGRSRILDLSNPGTKKYRDAFFETWGLMYVSYMGHMIFYPVNAKSIRVHGSMLKDCHQNGYSVACTWGEGCDLRDYDVGHVSDAFDDGTYVNWYTKVNTSTTPLGTIAKHTVDYGTVTLVTYTAFNFSSKSLAKDVIDRYLN